MGNDYLQVGEIEDVRLVTNYKGKSKGYAYVQFKDEVVFSIACLYLYKFGRMYAP